MIAPTFASCIPIPLILDHRALVALCRRPGGRGGGRKTVSTCAHRVSRDSLARSMFHWYLLAFGLAGATVAGPAAAKTLSRGGAA